MDIKNLLGPIPSTTGSVFAKTLNESPIYAPRTNLLLEIWRGCKDSQTAPGTVTVVGLVLSCGAFMVNPLLGCVVLVLYLYLEIAVVLQDYFPNVFRRLSRLIWRDEEIMIPGYAEAVAMINKSPNAIERSSLFLGAVDGTNHPVLLPPSILANHLNITGPTGSAKSYGALHPLTLQLADKKTHVICILDLAGDEAAMHMYRAKAKALGIPFHCFTHNPNRNGQGYNPIMQSHLGKSPRERGLVVIQGLGLATGSTKHGEAYFQSKIEKLGIREFDIFKQQTLRKMIEEIDNLATGDLARKLDMTAREIEHGEHLNSELTKLSCIAGLNQIPDEHAIDFKRIIIKGEPAIIYFGLDATLDKSGAAAIARMALFSISGALTAIGPDHIPVLVTIDEAQEMLGSVVAPIYKAIRKKGCMIWTCHQDFQDLANCDIDMTSIVSGGAAVGIHLGARDIISRKHIQGMGGKIITTKKSINAKGEETIIETETDRISTDDFDRVNTYQELAFVSINGTDGFAAFRHIFICRLLGFPNSREEFEMFKRMPWPTFPGGVRASEDPPPPPPKMPGAVRGALIAAALSKLASVHAGRP